MKALGLDTVAMVKKSDKFLFRFNGETLSVKAIYQRSKKRCGRAKYLLSAVVDVCSGEETIPARLVFVRNRNKKSDYLVLLSTLVFTRYIFLAVAIREDKDDRSAGPLFCLVCDEIADITFLAAMEKLQQFLEKVFREFNGLGIEIQKVLAALKADLPADIAALFDFDRLLAAFC